MFGRRAGFAAAEHAKASASPVVDSAQIDEAERQLLAPFERPTGENPYTIHSDLQEMLQSLVGIFRTEDDLQRALGELEKFKVRAALMRVEGSRLFNPGWHLSRDLQHMLVVAEAVTRSALARQESRGAHSRIDFPKTEEAWGKKNHVIARQGNAMKLSEVPVREMPDELKQILAEEK